tara:strand:- start:52 stop:276 length:225 start_codon:yes stop_codon:yes gene_type:complete
MLKVPTVVAIIGDKALNDRVFLVPIIFNQFIYKLSPIAIPTIPLITRKNIELRSDNQFIDKTTGKKKMDARIFL